MQLHTTPVVDKSLAAYIAAEYRLLRSGQAPRVANEVVLYAALLPAQVSDSVEFYTLGVVACHKASLTDTEEEFRTKLRQCSGYTPGVEVEIARLIREPSQDPLDRLGRTIKEWWTRTMRR